MFSKFKGSLPRQFRKILPFKHSRRTRSPFANLPTDLCLLIFTYAARPIFTPDCVEGRNPYSSALALCCVSRIVRRTVIPEFLHTILLPMPDDVLAFLHALQMQNIYALQKHHLQVDYAAHARRIWIGETKLINGGLSKNPRFHLDRHHFSLLAPVLLASQSLAVDVTSLYVLDRCIEHAWKSHTRSNIDESSTLPWSVKTLTLAGCLAYYRPTCTAEGYAFLASISHIIFLSPTSFYRFPGELLSFDGEPNLLSRDNLPERMNKFPWTYLKSIQSVSLVLPDRALKSSQFHHWSRLGHGWRDEQVELLRFSSPTDLLSGLDNWPVKIADEYFARRRDGRDIPLVHIRATATCCSRLVIYVSLHWEQAWAYEL